jgi:hypothetical protein
MALSDAISCTCAECSCCIAVIGTRTGNVGTNSLTFSAHDLVCLQEEDIWGHGVAQLLQAHATSRKARTSIPDEVMEFFFN